MFAFLAVSLALTLQAADPSAEATVATEVAPVTATGVAAAPTQPDPAEDPSLDRVVCHSEAVVGTRFPSRVCMTRREWNARRDESRALAHRLEAANSNRGRVEAPGH